MLPPDREQVPLPQPQAIRACLTSDVAAEFDAEWIAPSELTKLPVPAPANGHTDSTTEAVRLARPHH